MHTENWDTEMDDQRQDHLDLESSLKETSSNNYRPITCVQIMWKILTAQIRKEIYYSLKSCGIFLKEQKGGGGGGPEALEN